MRDSFGTLKKTPTFHKPPKRGAPINAFDHARTLATHRIWSQPAQVALGNVLAENRGDLREGAVNQQVLDQTLARFIFMQSEK
jgi:hypothetical protein